MSLNDVREEAAGFEAGTLPKPENTVGAVLNRPHNEERTPAAVGGGRIPRARERAERAATQRFQRNRRSGGLSLCVDADSEHLILRADDEVAVGARVEGNIDAADEERGDVGGDADGPYLCGGVGGAG